MSVWDDAARAVEGRGPEGPSLGDLAAGPTALLASFGLAFEQTTRLLKLYFPAGSGLPANLLLPHRLTGSEAVNGEFRFVLDTLSSEVHLELKTLLGQPVALTILTDSGAEQELCGIVSAVSQTGSDGGFAGFRLVIESALAVLRHRVTARVFTQTDVRAITATILGEHQRDNPVLAACFSLDDRCSKAYPEQPFWLQYGESDTDFLRRIWARAGLSYVIQPGPGSSVDHPQHALVLFDDGFDLDVNASATVRFHRADGTEPSDAITRWSAHRVLQSGAVSRSAWEQASATLHTASETSQAHQGAYGNGLASTLEDYTHEPEHGPASLEAAATRRMQVKEQRTKSFAGEGSVRTFQAGTWFTLTQHADQGAFMLTRVEVEAVNNLPKDLQSGLAGLLRPRAELEPPYRNRFTCLRRGIPIVPEELAPPIPGLLTARVVGPGKEEVHTDELGRLRIRFLFTREHEHAQAGASETDADSAWVRQAELSSSQGFGGNFVPRVGDEVVVQFLGDDPDQPVVVGSVHNGVRPPASFGAVSVLPQDRALSGFRSKEHFGQGANELVLDDTPNELRARLASSHERTELNLGHLVHPRCGGVADPRGEGFELRTDAYGALRAERGLLVTTEGQAAGPHAEAKELIEQTNAALALTQALSDASENHQAGKLAVIEQTRHLKTVVEATPAHPAGQRRAGGGAESILALSSPAGIVEGTPGTIVKSTGRNLHLTSGGDTNLAVGRRLVMAIQDAWSVLAAKGIKLFAGKGDIALQAHEGSLELTAEKNLSLVACKQGIDLAAPDKLTLASGGAKVTLAGGSMKFIGQVNFKGNVNVITPQARTYDMPDLRKVDEVHDRHFQVVDENTGDPLPHTRYELTTDSGKKIKGITDAAGYTGKVAARAQEGAEVRVFTDADREEG